MIDGTVQTPKPRPTIVMPPIEIRPVVQEVSGQEVSGAEPPAWVGKMLKWLFPVGAVLFIALIVIPGFLQKWLWMRQLDYVGIFWTLLSVQCLMFCAAFIFNSDGNEERK